MAEMVDPMDLVGIAELSADLGRKRSTICMWAARNVDFPRPVVVLAAGPVYSRAAVRKWLSTRP